MSSGGPTVPPGHYAPFAVVTEDDHRAWILVAAALGVSFTLVTVTTRILIRLFVNKGWGVDDTLCIVSTIISWIQAGLVLASAGAGLGKSVDSISNGVLGTVQQVRSLVDLIGKHTCCYMDNKLSPLQSYFASNIFYIIALDLSKLSVVFFLRRLVVRGSKLLTFTFVFGVALLVSMFAFIIVTSLQCQLLAPWDIVGESCSSWFVRWQVHGVVECLFEVLMCAAPIWLVWNLQTAMENKTEVVLPFALRLVLIFFTSMRLGSFNSSGFADDFTLREAPYICWTQAELTYSIIAATIPTARRLMLDFITYYNGGNFNTSESRTGTRTGNSKGGLSNNSQGESIQMRSFRSTGGKKSNLGYATVSRLGRAREGDEEGRMGDGESTDMIIRKDISIHVDNEMGDKQDRLEKVDF